MRRLAALVRPLEGGRRRWLRSIEVDRLAQLGGVVLRRQPRQRHVFDEIGIAEVVGAIRVRTLHRLGHQMDRGRRLRTQPREVVAFEHIQHLDQPDAARADRRHGENFVAAIGAFDRRAADGPVVLQVLACNQTAVREHLLLEREGRLALVEPGRPLAGDALERVREIRLLQGLSRLVGHAVLRELRHRRRELLHLRQHALEGSRQSVAHGEAVARFKSRRYLVKLPHASIR